VRESTKLLDDAVALVKAGDYLGATTLCFEVLRAQPRNARLPHARVIYALTGSTSRACEAYRRYVKLAPLAGSRRVVELVAACPH